MPAEWVALRGAKNGESRGYWKDAESKYEPRRRNKLPRRAEELGQHGLSAIGVAGKICRYLSVKELRTEMQKDMPNRRIINTRKVPLIKEWFDYGDPYHCHLVGIRMLQGGRNPI